MYLNAQNKNVPAKTLARPLNGSWACAFLFAIKGKARWRGVQQALCLHRVDQTITSDRGGCLMVSTSDSHDSVREFPRQCLPPVTGSHLPYHNDGSIKIAQMQCSKLASAVQHKVAFPLLRHVYIFSFIFLFSLSFSR